MHLQDSRIAALGDRLIECAAAAGVRTLLVNGSLPDDWGAVLASAGSRNGVRLIPFLGLHPWFVDQTDDAWRRQLASLAMSHACGIGEIGLDHMRKHLDRNAQRAAFVWQLSLAAELGRPVSIHCLKAWGEMLEILSETDLPPAVQLHSFGGPVEIAERLAERGVYFSFAANIADPRRKRARKSASFVPRDRLLIESDCPDLPPPPDAPHYDEQVRPVDPEGRRVSEPADIPATLATLAELRGEDPNELAEVVEANARRFIAPLENCP